MIDELLEETGFSLGEDAFLLIFGPQRRLDGLESEVGLGHREAAEQGE